MMVTREISGKIRVFQSVLILGEDRQVLLPADFVIQWRCGEEAGVCRLGQFIGNNPLDAEDLITLTPGEQYDGGGGAAPPYQARCLRSTGRYTLHDPGTGDVLHTARTEDEAADRWTAIVESGGDGAVVIDQDGTLAQINPMGGRPEVDEDDARAFAEMRARWDAALVAIALDPYADALLDGDAAAAQAIYEAADPATRVHLDQFDHGAACSRSSDPRSPRG